MNVETKANIRTSLNIPAAIDDADVLVMPGCALGVLNVGATDPKSAFDNSLWADDATAADSRVL